MKNIEKINILIIRLSSIGDIILTSPIIRALKNKYPDSNIDFVCQDNYSSLLENNPHLRNIYKYSRNFDYKSLLDFKSKIINSNNDKYTYVIDLQLNRRSKSIKKGLGYKYFNYNKNRLNKLSLVYRKKAINPIHVTQLYYSAIESIANPLDDLGLELWTKKDIAQNNYIPFTKEKKSSIKKIAIAPGAQHYTKRWLPERFAELCDELNKSYSPEIYLFGSKDEKDVCDFIKNYSDANIKNLAGETSINETIELIDECDLMICNDTGLMHIAAARQIPIIAIFGSTVTELGFTPYKTNHIIIQKPIECRPCSHIGLSKCPKKHFLCMKSITATDILVGISKLHNFSI